MKCVGGLRFYLGPGLSIAEYSLENGHVGLAFTLKKNNKSYFTVQLAVSQGGHGQGRPDVKLIFH